MTFPWISGAKYSSVALAACGSGVGACCLMTHHEPEKVEYVKLSRVVKAELASHLKEDIYTKSTACVNKERERLVKVREKNHWAYSYQKQEEKPNFDPCLNDLPLDGVVQKLFTRDSE